MIESIEALGRRTPIQTAPDVFATDGRSGKAEQTAAMKPSLVVTQGAQNRAASAVEKATEKAQKLDDRLRHDDPTLVPGDVLRAQNNTPNPV